MHKQISLRLLEDPEPNSPYRRDNTDTDQYSIDHHKLHLHPERVAQWLAAGQDWDKLKKIYPLYVEVATNGACNHRCSFCAVDYIGYKNVRQSTTKLLDAFDNMAASGVKSVMFGGEGEPLLHPDIGMLIKKAKAFGLDVAVTTNAVFLTEKLSWQCLGDITWLKASVNAGSAAAYAAIHKTKEADFWKVIDNLKAAVSVRKKEALKTTLGAQMVLLPDNEHTVGELCATGREIGLDYVVIKPYSQHPSSVETAKKYGDIQYTNQTLSQQLSAFNTATFKVVYRERTMGYLAEPERTYKTCHATPMFWAYIMANGDVYGCGAHLLDNRFKFGNINDQSFSEIWEGDARRKCVEMMANFNISECRKNCRMEHQNRFLDSLKNPNQHLNFI